MKVGFFCSKRPRCIEFAELFRFGVQRCGDELAIRPVLKAHGDPHEVDGEIVPDVDVAIINAILHRKAFKTMYDAGIPVVYIDKAYNRNWDWRRVSIGAHQPTHYLGFRGKRDGRRVQFGWEPATWRRKGSHVLLAWSDNRDHEWRGWPPPEVHVRPVIIGLQHFTDRKLYYGAKPNYHPSASITSLLDIRNLTPDAQISDYFTGCHALVTPGTSVCLQAMLVGIPTIVLADAIVRSISSTCICQIESPYLATQHERIQLLNDLAYCQWHKGEFADGTAWFDIRDQLEEGVGVNVKS
jgi:hypothetical protein